MERLFCLLIGLLITVTLSNAQVTDTLRRDTTLTRRSRLAEIKEPAYVMRSNELTWFQRGAFMGGASLGFGLGKELGLYVIFTPRIAYFIQRSLAIGLKGAFESRLSTSYRANQAAGFLRYYALKKRFQVFGEGGFGVGRYRQSNTSLDDRRLYSSINLGIGLGYQALTRLGIELVIENNYYDKTPAFAGSNRGPQLKLGLNYHLSPRRYVGEKGY